MLPWLVFMSQDILFALQGNIFLTVRLLLDHRWNLKCKQADSVGLLGSNGKHILFHMTSIFLYAWLQLTRLACDISPNVYQRDVRARCFPSTGKLQENITATRVKQKEKKIHIPFDRGSREKSKAKKLKVFLKKIMPFSADIIMFPFFKTTLETTSAVDKWNHSHSNWTIMPNNRPMWAQEDFK